MTVQLRAEAFALERECDGVMVRYEDLATGSLLRCQARYVVGADGMHSSIREAAGITFTGGRYAQSFVLADVRGRSPGPRAVTPGGFAWPPRVRYS